MSERENVRANVRRGSDPKLPPGRILLEAASLFAHHGVDSTSMRMLAERLGVTKAALYYHFASKEDLHFEIHRSVMNEMISQLRVIAASSDTAARKTEAVIVHMITSIARRKDEFTVMLREGTLLRTADWEVIESQRDEFRGLIREILREGQSTGEFDVPDLNSATFALLGMCNWAFTWLRADGPLSSEQIAQHFSHIFLNGIAARSFGRGV